MDGILNINKPVGPTSHDVVARIRRAVRQYPGRKRVGHAGTLDPAASGVLLVCLGSATRMVEYLVDWRKEYRATAVLGLETDTQDATGSVVREADCSYVNREMVEAELHRFIGRILQIPPMVSAVHHNGRRLYELARAGLVVERAPRPVDIYSLRLIGFTSGARPEIDLHVECSKGTYVRTLCADIGNALGCGAYMSSLVRTAVGRFRLEDTVSIEVVEEKAAAGELAEILHSIDEALDELPSISISHADAMRVSNGVLLAADDLLKAGEVLPPVGSVVRIHAPDTRLIAVARISCLPGGEHVLRPEKVFPAGKG